MRFLVSIITFLCIDVFLLWYLVRSSYFSPFSMSGDIDLWNIGVFVMMVSFAAGLVVSFFVYLFEKVLYCGRREFPYPARAIRFGVLTVFCIAAGLLLHIFHFLNFGVLLLLFFLGIVGIVLIR